MRRFNFIEVLLVFLAVVLIVLTFLVVVVMAYPKAGDRAIRNIRFSLESALGTDIEPRVNNFLIRMGKRAKAGWEQRVKKIPSRFTGLFQGSGNQAVRRKQVEKKKTEEAKFLNCINCIKI